MNAIFKFWIFQGEIRSPFLTPADAHAHSSDNILVQATKNILTIGENEEKPASLFLSTIIILK